MAFTSNVGMKKELCGYYTHVNGDNFDEDCDLIILYKCYTMSPVKHDHNLGISVLLLLLLLFFELSSATLICV